MKLGIVGSGGIIKTALDAIKEAGNIEVKAIWNRRSSHNKLDTLAKKYNIENKFTNYDEFLSFDGIDTVYIGIINSLHYEYALKALKNGLNVICEKPFTTTILETNRLIELAKRNKLFLFEAITTIYLPNFQFIKEKLSYLGDVKLIQCNFSQYSSRYDQYLEKTVLPVFNPKLAGGALYDINIYNLHFVIALFGEPESLYYFPNRGFNGVDTSGTVVLHYPTFVATCSGAKDSSSDNFAMIQGDSGFISIDGSVNKCSSVEVVFGNQKKNFQYNQYENPLVHEFIAFREIISSDDHSKCYELLDHTFKVMNVLDELRVKASLF